MSGLGRRGFLGVLGAAPVAVRAAAQQAAAGISTFGSSRRGASNLSGPVGSPIRTDGSRQFRTIEEWWSGGGEKRARDMAEHVSSLDPDLTEMRLPLATKVRMQRLRNYERNKRFLLDDMAGVLKRNGFIEWWT